MPAPISPSLDAFSSTSEAMPFWASARAAARPPIPPPAMRILSWSTHDLFIMQPGDLMVRQTKDSRKNLVRMLAQGRRDPGRLPRDRAKLQWRRRHWIAADAGLVEDGEERIVVHRVLVGRQLAKGLVGRPQGTCFLQRRADVGSSMGGHPRLDHRAELGSGRPAT